MKEKHIFVCIRLSERDPPSSTTQTRLPQYELSVDMSFCTNTQSDALVRDSATTNKYLWKKLELLRSRLRIGMMRLDTIPGS